MPSLFGTSWSKDELRRRVGHESQLGGITRVVLDDGAARGARAAILRTGGGLEAEILLDRAMDLGRVNLNGMALAFQAPCGTPHPSFYDNNGPGWLRTFGGGLLATCGLQNVGGPCEDEGLAHGVHGGIGTTPAAKISERADWSGDEYAFEISGEMREVPALGLFGPNLRLNRTIRSKLGANELEIEDVVTNDGFADASLMLLYHINVGFPVVDEGAKLIGPTKKVTPRDAAAEPGIDAYATFEKPQPGYAEQVFFHDMARDGDGRVQAGIVSPARDGKRLALVVDYDAATLPNFIEWKQMGAGPYVVGLEPANCLVMGRADERKRGTLQTLKAGESRRFHLRLRALNDAGEIDALQVALAKRAAGQ